MKKSRSKNAQTSGAPTPIIKPEPAQEPQENSDEHEKLVKKTNFMGSAVPPALRPEGTEYIGEKHIHKSN